MGLPRRSPPPRPAAALAALACVLATVLCPGPATAAASARAPEAIEGTQGPDRLTGTPAADLLRGLSGADLLEGRGGGDVLEGGPGWDVLRGGAGDDRLTDGSYGAGIIAGGPGDDVISSAPRGMERVSCGAGTDTVSADALDIVAADCETVTRVPGPRGTPLALTEVRSATGGLLGSTGYPLAPGGAAGPYRLLWAHDGYTYLATRFRAADACFVTVEPGGGSRGECGLGHRGGLFVRRIEGPRFQWFALVPDGVRSLRVGGRAVPVHHGVAVFAGPRRPGPVVARGDGRTFAMRVP